MPPTRPLRAVDNMNFTREHHGTSLHPSFVAEQVARHDDEQQTDAAIAAANEQDVTIKPEPSLFMQAAQQNETLLHGMLKAVVQPMDALRQEQDAFRLDMEEKVRQHVEAGFDLAARLEKMAAEAPLMRAHMMKMREYIGKALVPTPTTD